MGDAPVPAEESAPGEGEAESLEAAPQATDEPESKAFSGVEQLALGDLGEGRRESVARRLRALRGPAVRLPRPGPLRRPQRTGGPRGAGIRARASAVGTGVGGAAASARTRVAGGARSAGTGISAAGGGIAAAGGRVSRSWHGIPLIVRQRIAAGAIVVGLVAIVVLVLVPRAPCGAPGGDDCPPTDDAIALVPADALVYAHLDIDRESAGFQATSALADRLPLITALVEAGLADAGGAPVDFGSQIRPWAGGEAALAVLPGTLRPERVAMIEAADVDGAREFAAGIVGPSPTIKEVDGIEVSVGPRGTAAGLLEGFLLLGDLDGVSRMIASDGAAGRLESSDGAALLDELPEGQVASAFMSGAGARFLLRDPAVSALDTFVDSEAASAVAVGFGVEDDVASLTVRSELDPEAAGDSPSFFSALPAFSPGLSVDVGADALAYLGVGEPADSIDGLLTQAASSAPGLLGAFNKASETLRREGGISIADDLLPLLGSEAALSVEPVAAAGASETPGVLTPAGVPYVTLLADGVDSEAAAGALAELQGPLVAALAPGGGEAAGQVSVFEPLQIAGIEAQSLTISPNVQLTYATYDDRLALATNPLGIEQARSGGDGLADSEAFQNVADGLPGEVSLLAYFDLQDLIALGEQVGLATDPGYATLAPDLRALEAAAVAVADDEDQIRTDVRVALGDAEAAQVEAPALPGE